MKDAVVAVASACEELSAAGLSRGAIEAILQCMLVTPLPKRHAQTGDPKCWIGLAWNSAEIDAIQRHALEEKALVMHTVDDWRLAVGLMRQEGAGHIVSARLEAWPGPGPDARIMERVAEAHGGRWIFADGLHCGSTPDAVLARGMVLAVREFHRAGGGR